MSETILSTAYFPDINYFSELKNSEKIVLDHGEHFIKQSRRNRCNILGANGVLKLIIPLKKWKNNTPVKDICISYDENWQKQHWKSLESAYRSAPYFEFYEDKIRDILFGNRFDFLTDLNLKTIDFYLNTLSLTNQIRISEQYISDLEEKTDKRQIEFTPNYLLENQSPYNQVFSSPAFVSNLSLLDLIFNQGPNSIHLF